MKTGNLFHCMSAFSAVCLLLLAPCQAAAGVAGFKPFLAVSEDVTDNVFEVPGGRRTEYTTRVMPGGSFTYQSPLWTWDAAYSFEYRNYARGSKADEYNHDAALKGNIALIGNYLFLDLNDTYHRVSLDVSRNAATESSLFLNQTDQNIAVVSPYLLWRMRGDNTLKTGYRYTDTRYWDSGGIDKREHRGFGELTHDVTARFSISAGYAFTRLDSLASRYNRHDLSAGLRYEYADKSFVYGQIGNSWQFFDTGRETDYLFWTAGVTHDFSSAVATLETRVLPAEDPLTVSTKETTYSAKLDVPLQRGTVGFSTAYSEYVNSESGLMDRHRLGFSASSRYEILPDLTASLAASMERFSRKTVTDHPYRFTGSAGMSYVFKNELSFGVTYTYVNNLLDLDTTADSIQVNKAVVELKKVF